MDGWMEKSRIYFPTKIFTLFLSFSSAVLKHKASSTWERENTLHNTHCSRQSVLSSSHHHHHPSIHAFAQIKAFAHFQGIMMMTMIVFLRRRKTRTHQHMWRNAWEEQADLRKTERVLKQSVCCTAGLKMIITMSWVALCWKFSQIER